MSRATFGDLSKGDRIELGGKAWVVAKAKHKGKIVRLTITGNGGEFTREVKAKDAVTLAADKDSKKSSKIALDGPKGEQQRWATPKEYRKSLPPGDPEQTAPPAKPEGAKWNKGPTDETETMLAETLGAVLVGESTDEDKGYYVPPVDVETVAAHLLTFHGVGGSAYASMEEALVLHEQHHADAATGAAMQTNHWHTKRRP